MEDGIINIDTDRAKTFNFSSNDFEKVTYLWKVDDTIMISFIISKRSGEGNFGKLLKNITDKGYFIAVPTPSNKMIAILEKKGFKWAMDEGCELLTNHPKICNQTRNTG